MRTYIEKYIQYCTALGIAYPDNKAKVQFVEKELASYEVEEFLEDILNENKIIKKIFPSDKIATSFEVAYDFIFNLSPRILERCQESIENFYRSAVVDKKVLLINRIEAVSSETGLGLRETFIKELIEECSIGDDVKETRLLILLVKVQKSNRNEDSFYWKRIIGCLNSKTHLVIPALYKYYQNDINLCTEILQFYDRNGFKDIVSERYGLFFEVIMKDLLKKVIGHTIETEVTYDDFLNQFHNKVKKQIHSIIDNDPLPIFRHTKKIALQMLIDTSHLDRIRAAHHTNKKDIESRLS